MGDDVTTHRRSEDMGEAPQTENSENPKAGSSDRVDDKGESVRPSDSLSPSPVHPDVERWWTAASDPPLTAEWFWQVIENFEEWAGARDVGLADYLAAVFEAVASRPVHPDVEARMIEAEEGSPGFALNLHEQAIKQWWKAALRQALIREQRWERDLPEGLWTCEDCAFTMDAQHKRRAQQAKAVDHFRENGELKAQLAETERERDHEKAVVQQVIDQREHETARADALRTRLDAVDEIWEAALREVLAREQTRIDAYMGGKAARQATKEHTGLSGAISFLVEDRSDLRKSLDAATEALAGGLEWERCGSCGERYPDVYWADDEQWAKVVGDQFAGLRCPACFWAAAEALGLEPKLVYVAPPLKHLAALSTSSEPEPTDELKKKLADAIPQIEREVEAIREAKKVPRALLDLEIGTEPQEGGEDEGRA